MAWSISSNLPWREAKECLAIRWKTPSAKRRGRSRAATAIAILAPRVKAGKVKVVGAVYRPERMIMPNS
jgi:hypothetical protein